MMKKKTIKISKFFQKADVFDNDPVIIKQMQEVCKDRLIENIKKMNYILVGEAETNIDPLHFSSHCSYPDCKNDDLEKCSETHPDYIVTKGPFTQIAAWAKVVPAKYEKYLEYVKDGVAKHASFIQIIEVDECDGEMVSKMSNFVIEQHNKYIVAVKSFDTIKEMTDFAKKRMMIYSEKYNEIWGFDACGFTLLNEDEPNEKNYMPHYQTERKKFVYPNCSIFLISNYKNAKEVPNPEDYNLKEELDGTD